MVAGTEDSTLGKRSLESSMDNLTLDFDFSIDPESNASLFMDKVMKRASSVPVTASTFDSVYDTESATAYKRFIKVLRGKHKKTCSIMENTIESRLNEISNSKIISKIESNSELLDSYLEFTKTVHDKTSRAKRVDSNGNKILKQSFLESAGKTKEVFENEIKKKFGSDYLSTLNGIITQDKKFYEENPEVKYASISNKFSIINALNSAMSSKIEPIKLGDYFGFGSIENKKPLSELLSTWQNNRQKKSETGMPKVRYEVAQLSEILNSGGTWSYKLNKLNKVLNDAYVSRENREFTNEENVSIELTKYLLETNKYIHGNKTKTKDGAIHATGIRRTKAMHDDLAYQKFKHNLDNAISGLEMLTLSEVVSDKTLFAHTHLGYAYNGGKHDEFNNNIKEVVIEKSAEEIRRMKKEQATSVHSQIPHIDEVSDDFAKTEAQYIEPEYLEPEYCEEKKESLVSRITNTYSALKSKFSIPKFNIPKFNVPKLQIHVNVPKISMPSLPEIDYAGAAKKMAKAAAYAVAVPAVAAMIAIGAYKTGVPIANAYNEWKWAEETKDTITALVNTVGCSSIEGNTIILNDGRKLIIPGGVNVSEIVGSEIASMSKEEKEAREIAEYSERTLEDLEEIKEQLGSKGKEGDKYSGNDDNLKSAKNSGNTNGKTEIEIMGNNPNKYSSLQKSRVESIDEVLEESYPTDRWDNESNTGTYGSISSGYGDRTHPVLGGTRKHTGIDIRGNKGDPIYSVREGIVVYTGWMGGYGYTTVVFHPKNGFSTWYAHGLKDSFSVKPGEEIAAGTKIMEVGKTGITTGYHLHYEIRTYEGRPINPTNAINRQALFNSKNNASNNEHARKGAEWVKEKFDLKTEIYEAAGSFIGTEKEHGMPTK